MVQRGSEDIATPPDSWSSLVDWWLAELEGDDAYETVITPLLFELFEPVRGATYLDVGAGEGRVARSVEGRGAQVHGLDINEHLARRFEPAVVAPVSQIPIKPDSYDGAYCVLTLEHVETTDEFFTETAEVVKPGGVLVLVMNHPIWTAPGSTPITDSDGEVLWRSGMYFSSGSTDVATGDSLIRFHHRSTADLLNSAAEAGWMLTRMVERPHHDLESQSGIPRLLGCSWRLED